MTEHIIQAVQYPRLRSFLYLSKALKILENINRIFGKADKEIKKNSFDYCIRSMQYFGDFFKWDQRNDYSSREFAQ